MKRPHGPVSAKPVPLVGVVGYLRVDFWYPGRDKTIRPHRYSVRRGGAWELLRDRHEEENMPRPPDQSALQAGVTLPRKKSSMFAKLPELASYLTDVLYPDKTPVGNLQLSVRTRGALVVAQMKLASNGGLRLTVEESCLDDALVALEAALSASPVPWEPDPYPLDGMAKKKK